MTTLATPESTSGELTPWRPSERAQIKQSLLYDNITDVIADPNPDEAMQRLHDQIDLIDRRFVITGIGVQAVNMAIGYSAVGAHVFHRNETVSQGRDDVQREFERDVLKLEPDGSIDGLRHYESPAGFGGGNYPTEAFARLVGSSPEKLNEILSDEDATKFGHVIVKYDNFLIPVKEHPFSPKNLAEGLVVADRAKKLSETGETLLDIALHIADYSTKDE